jgi:hypothetical protein
MPDQQFQIRITTPADTSGIKQTEAELDRLQSKAETAGKGFAQPFLAPQPAGAIDVAATAAKQQQIAIESQLQVIESTRNELLAAQIAGNTTLAAQLRLELAVRQASLTAMRAQTLTQAELVALTANEEALLSGIAAQHGRSAVALSLNRTQAASLAQSLLTGNLSVQSLSRSLSGLAAPLSIAGIAGYAIYQSIAHAADESLKLAQNVDKQTDALIKSVREWNNAAKAAGSFGDVINLGKSITPGLEEAAAKLQELRDKEITGWAKVKDAIIGAFTTPAGATEKASPFKKAMEAAIADQEKLNAVQLEAANKAVDRAQAAADAWERVKAAPLVEGIREYTAELDKAKAKEEELGAVRRRSVADFENYIEAAKNVQLLTDRLKSLTDQEEKRSKLRNETLASLQAELAIDRARAAGKEETAKKLERQRDLQKEINDLIAKGLTAEEARTAAIEKQNLELQIQANKEGLKRPADETRQRHLDISGRDVTESYADAQARGRLTPETPSALPARAPGAELSGAAQKVQAGGEELGNASSELDKAGTDLTAQAKELQAAAKKVSSAAAPLAGLRAELNNLEARLKAVESR